MKNYIPKGKTYYLSYKTGFVYDSCNRKTRFTKDDFYAKGQFANHKFFISTNPIYWNNHREGNAVFYKIFDMTRVIHYIYKPSPFKNSAIKDNALYLYDNDEDYLKAIISENYYNSYAMLFNWDTIDFSKFFQYYNKELGKQMNLEIRKRRYTGRW